VLTERYAPAIASGKCTSLACPQRQTGISDEDGGEDPIIETPRLVAALDPARNNGAKVIQIVGGNMHSLFLLGALISLPRIGS
jgi:hypothetical protein